MKVSKPLVSIWCPAFNHENYIEQCLDNYINQQTNFPFEIVVHDDASTDNTLKIIKEYQTKYPDLFNCIFQTENQLSKDKSHLLKTMRKFCKGKYIALCEGDDYWTDQFKLQKQVDFLEQNSKCSYVFTKKKILNPDGSFTNDRTYSLPDVFDLHTLLKKNIMPSTQTVVFKKKYFPVNNLNIFNTTFNGDWVLLFLLTHNSLLGFINEETAVYRKGVGIISKTNNLFKFKNGLETNKELNKLTNHKYDYHIGKKEWHLENITYACLEEKDLLKGAYYFFWKIIRSLKENKFNSNIISNNFVFFKQCVKLIFNKKT
jgi:glycosyltransferase involved in cell wall biosynthesis